MPWCLTLLLSVPGIMYIHVCLARAARSWRSSLADDLFLPTYPCRGCSAAAQSCSSGPLFNYKIIHFSVVYGVTQCNTNPPLHLPEAECDATPQRQELYSSPPKPNPRPYMSLLETRPGYAQTPAPSLLPTRFLISCLLALVVGPAGPCCPLSDPPTSLLP